MQILNFDLNFRLSWLEIAKKLLLQVVDIFDGYKCAKSHKSTISASVVEMDLKFLPVFH